QREPTGSRIRQNAGKRGPHSGECGYESPQRGPTNGWDTRLVWAGAWQPSPDRQADRPVRNVWDASGLTLDRRFADEDVGSSAAAFSSDGQRVATAWGAAADPAVVTICAGHTGTELQALRGHTGVVAALALGPDGQ